MGRASIPENRKFTFQLAMKQVCIYAYPYSIVMKFDAQKRKTPIESIEDLEIIRLLEMGYEVQMIEVSGQSIAVDTPEDLERVREIIYD